MPHQPCATCQPLRACLRPCHGCIASCLHAMPCHAFMRSSRARMLTHSTSRIWPKRKACSVLEVGWSPSQESSCRGGTACASERPFFDISSTSGSGLVLLTHSSLHLGLLGWLSRSISISSIPKPVSPSLSTHYKHRSISISSIPKPVSPSLSTHYKHANAHSPHSQVPTKNAIEQEWCATNFWFDASLGIMRLIPRAYRAGLSSLPPSLPPSTPPCCYTCATVWRRFRVTAPTL
jgi:hypothetical protein